MKRILILIILVSLAAVAVMGQNEEYRYALRTQTLTRTMMENLDLPEDQIRAILRLQNQYRIKAERGAEETGEYKRKIAAEFNSPNANLRRINRWLGSVNEIRLELEIAQAALYQQTRNRFGEERWNEVVRGTDVHDPLRIRTEEPLQTQTRETSQDGSDSGNAEPSKTQTRTGSSDDADNSSSSPSSNSGNATPAPAKR